MNNLTPEQLKLNRDEVNHELESLMSAHPDVSISTEEMLRGDMIDKLGRYGAKSYNRKFANNPSGNVCAHMRSFNFVKDMGSLIDKQIEELKHEQIRLNRLLGPDTNV